MISKKFVIINPNKSLTYLLLARLIVLFDDIESIWYWGLLIKNSNKLEIDINIDINC